MHACMHMCIATISSHWILTHLITAHLWLCKQSRFTLPPRDYFTTFPIFPGLPHDCISFLGKISELKLWQGKKSIQDRRTEGSEKLSDGVWIREVTRVVRVDSDWIQVLWKRGAHVCMAPLMRKEVPVGVDSSLVKTCAVCYLQLLVRMLRWPKGRLVATDM